MLFDRNTVIATLLASLCHYIIVTTGCLGHNSSTSNYPEYFPCQWSDGLIPYVFDFYAITSKRLRSIIRLSHEYIQNQSCFVFNERNPIEITGSRRDYYYLYYTYSKVIENCCAATIEPGIGRRVVLITPACKEPPEIAHATLHMFGLTHREYQPFPPASVAAILRPEHCQKVFSRLDASNSTQSSETKEQLDADTDE